MSEHERYGTSLFGKRKFDFVNFDSSNKLCEAMFNMFINMFLFNRIVLLKQYVNI